MIADAPRTLTVEEYLDREDAALEKSEYIYGEVIPMPGASLNHNYVTANITGYLWVRLKGTGCRVLASDMRTAVDPEGVYFYPDVLVVCGKPDLVRPRPNNLLNPQVVFKVSSPSTRAYDRGKKFRRYQQMESLTDYLLVKQNVPSVEHWTRQPEGSWEPRETTGVNSVLEIASLGLSIPLADIYEGVDFLAPDDEA